MGRRIVRVVKVVTWVTSQISVTRIKIRTAAPAIRVKLVAHIKVLLRKKVKAHKKIVKAKLVVKKKKHVLKKAKKHLKITIKHVAVIAKKVVIKAKKVVVVVKKLIKAK